jgi:peptidoglycan-associated lipoprotein
MFARFLMLASVLLLVSACSHNKDKTAMDQQGMATQESSTAGAAGVGGVNGSTVAPGTEEDLTTNVGDRVFFGYDHYDISDEAKATLEKQATWLKQYANLNISVEGHADERGTREYNLALGERRANAVKNYLVALGIAPSRISTISYGKERPAVVGSNEAAWAQNRRGVTVVQ